MSLPGYCKLTVASLPLTVTTNTCYFVAETKKWYYFDGTTWHEHDENFTYAEKVQILSDIGILEGNITSLDGRVTTLEGQSASVSDGDKGDVTVSGNGTTWTVDSLPQSRITNLTTDLSGKQSTLVSGTNIKTLTIDGGSPTDLLGSGTININSGSGGISDGDKGDITVSGGGTIWTVDNLGNKQDTLVSGTNIKTINNQSILGSGNITISGGGTSEPDHTELWLKFNGANNSTDFIDDSKNNYLVIPVTGNPIISTTESRFGDRALYLNGFSNLSLPNINFLGNFTIECWIKTTNLASCGIISNPTNQQALWLESNGNCSYYQSNWSSPDLIGGLVSDNQWHHISVVRDRFTLIIFVDGLLKQQFNYNKLNSNLSSLLYIGSMDANSRFFNGYIDNLRISSKAIYTPTLYPNGFTLPDENFSVTAL